MIYNNTYHRTIRMKPDNEKYVYIDFNREKNKEGPKFRFFYHAKISKHKNLLAKGYFPNWSEKLFVIKKVKHSVPWT